MCSTPDGTEVGRAPSGERAATSLKTGVASCGSPVRAHWAVSWPAAPVPPSGARRETSNLTSLRSASTKARYPLVAGFAGRLAQDHAEQEFTGGLRELLDRLAAHPSVPVRVG